MPDKLFFHTYSLPPYLREALLLQYRNKTHTLQKKTKTLVLKCLNDFVGKDFFNSPSRNPDHTVPKPKLEPLTAKTSKHGDNDED